jgi:hypothetical protein
MAVAVTVAVRLEFGLRASSNIPIMSQRCGTGVRRETRIKLGRKGSWESECISGPPDFDVVNSLAVAHVEVRPGRAVCSGTNSPTGAP